MRISRTALPFSNSAPGGADLHALAAAGAGVGIAPGLAQIRNDPGVAAAAEDVPGVGPLDFIADPHAARAQQAAVVIDAKRSWAGVGGQFGELIAQGGCGRGPTPPPGPAIRSCGWPRTPSRRGCVRRTAVRPAGAGGRADGRKWLRTTMPSETAAMQAAASFFWPTTSTRHRRQAPDVRQPSDVAQARDLDPVVPGDVENSFAVYARAGSPSISRVTTLIGRLLSRS